MLVPSVILAAVAMVLLAGSKSKEEGSEDTPVPPDTPDPQPPTTDYGGTIMDPPSGPVADAGGIVPAAATEEEKQKSAEALDEGEKRNWQAAVVAALESGDAATLDAVAKEMRAAGMVDQAKTLEAEATRLREAAVKLNAEEGLEVTVEEVKQAEPPPTLPEPDPRIPGAEGLVLYLNSLEPWTYRSEDQDTVREFQEEMKLVNAEGLYGVRTAMAVADAGFIPPPPYYWPPSGTQNAIDNYKYFLLQKSKSDPERADQWLVARAEAVRAL